MNYSEYNYTRAARSYDCATDRALQDWMDEGAERDRRQEEEDRIAEELEAERESLKD